MGNLPTFIVFEDGDKINFIDVNNVLVGYDLSCSCCENANWFISDKVIEKWPEKEEQDKNLDGFLFDKEFFMEISSIPSEDGYDHLGDGGMVVFKLINTGVGITPSITTGITSIPLNGTISTPNVTVANTKFIPDDEDLKKMWSTGGINGDTNYKQ